MELFRFNGLSSEDLMRPGQNPTKAFLGSMFKMAPVVSQPAEDEVALPAGAVTLQDVSDDHRWTEKELMALSKDKLLEMGSAMGVADLTQTKPKLVEAILALQ